MKIYREIVRNTEMGVQSIKNLLPYVEEEKFKSLIVSQQKTMDDFYNRAMAELDDEERKQAKSNPIQKTMLKAGVNMNAMFNNNSSHMADMLIEGYQMGVDSVQKCINELKQDCCDMPPIAGEVIRFYDKAVKALREYL